MTYSEGRSNAFSHRLCRSVPFNTELDQLLRVGFPGTTQPWETHLYYSSVR